MIRNLAETFDNFLNISHTFFKISLKFTRDFLKIFSKTEVISGRFAENFPHNLLKILW